MIYTLSPVNGGPNAVFYFEDSDGDGGAPPIINADSLLANTTYEGVITMLNKSISPPDNIHEEILEEGIDHQFFYTSTGSSIIILYQDEDNSGLPIGLSTKLMTADFSTGLLTITLRHLPEKIGLHVSEGDITNAGGETDIELTFPLVIK